MESQTEQHGSNQKELSESRRTEIAYHKKLNIYVAIGAAPIFLATGTFYYSIHKYLMAHLFFLMVINETTGVLLAFQIEKVTSLVRLKLISSIIAFTLLGAAMIIGMLDDEIYCAFPWLFIIPYIMLLFFGPRVGFYGALVFSLVTILVLLKLELPAWNAFYSMLFKINMVAALMAMLIFGLIAQSLRVRTQNELLSARNRSQAAEQSQRKSNFRLKHEVALRSIAEQERAKNEMRFRQIFEESPVPMREEDWSGIKSHIEAHDLKKDIDLVEYLRNRPDFNAIYKESIRVTAVNRAMLHLYEADTTESMLRNIAQIRAADGDACIDRIASLHGDGHYDAVTTSRTLRGRPLDLLIRITIPSGFMASWQKVFISAYDITDQIAMDRFNKRVANQLLRGQQVQAIATLAGGIAHQFNNRLAVIQGNLDLIKLKTDLCLEDRKLLSALQASAHRMGRLTDQLLAYAQGGKYQPQSFFANDLIQEIMDSGRLTNSAGIIFKLDLSKNICRCLGDITQIKMVMEAVLTNALESMPHGGELTITTHTQNIDRNNSETGEIETHSAGAPGSYALLCVADTGSGMDTETCQRIFEPFFTTKFFGRGMGMAAAYGIVRNHGGIIQVSSAPSRGTRVSIYLPCHQSQAHIDRP
jgi:signal transduction histidine kinase